MAIHWKNRFNFKNSYSYYAYCSRNYIAIIGSSNVIPVILIVLGIIGLGKAVLADDDKEIKTQVNKLITKFIAAVVIFFLPNLVTACFKLVNGFNEVEADYMICVNCISSPSNCQVSK